MYCLAPLRDLQTCWLSTRNVNFRQAPHDIFLVPSIVKPMVYYWFSSNFRRSCGHSPMTLTLRSTSNASVFQFEPLGFTFIFLFVSFREFQRYWVCIMPDKSKLKLKKKGEPLVLGFSRLLVEFDALWAIFKDFWCHEFVRVSRVFYAKAELSLPSPGFPSLLSLVLFKSFWHQCFLV